MRILFLHSSLNAGGAERTITTIANELGLLGEDVAVVTRLPGKDHYTLRGDVARFRTDVEGYTRGQRHNRVRLAAARQRAVDRAIVSFRPDVTVTFGLTSLASALVSRARGAKGAIIHSERSNPYVSHGGTIWRSLRQPLASLADGMIFQTEGARGYYRKLARKNAVIIQNPIHGELETDRNITRHADREQQVVVVGRLTPGKRVGFILRAFQRFHLRHPGYTLEVIGDGPERSSLEKLTRALNISGAVNFHGVTTDVAERLRRARFYVMASLHEGMPNSLMEAMAAGLTCFASDCDFGPRTLIQNGVSGWLFSVNDEDQLVNLMHREASDIAHSTLLGERASLITVSNSPRQIASQYLSYFKEIS